MSKGKGQFVTVFNNIKKTSENNKFVTGKCEDINKGTIDDP
jgi:hypothetical protein